MIANLTVTAKVGPGLTETAVPFTDVRELNFNFVAQCVTVIHGEARITREFSYTELATVTWTISGVTTTITVST